MDNVSSNIAVFVGQNQIKLSTDSYPFYTESVISIPYVDQSMGDEDGSWISQHHVILAITPRNEQANEFEVLQDHVQRFNDYILANLKLFESDDLENLGLHHFPQAYTDEQISELRIKSLKKAEGLKSVLEATIHDHSANFISAYVPTEDRVIDLPPIRLRECDLHVRLNKDEFSFEAITAHKASGYPDHQFPIIFNVEQAELDTLASMFDEKSAFKQMILNHKPTPIFDTSDLPF